MALLDAAAPGWEHRIELRTLDLSSCTRCIVGQVLALDSDALLYHGYNTLGVDRPQLYGFALDWGELGHRVTYGGLTRAWKRKIRDRRAVEVVDL